MSSLGVVVIGRNEGERLRACLQSVVGSADIVVYVDSGSTDGSLELARSMGALVIELDQATAFTAARARNAGLTRLQNAAPAIELVQFVDGDCEVDPHWLQRAEREIRADGRLAVVCGRRRERHPEASIYNRLCDFEWDTPIGQADACGGDALMRVEAVKAVGGYDDSLIAGEEPDLCLRMRRLDWRVLRIDAEMTVHDAALTRFGQWWKRNVRAGHAYAEGAALHGRRAERHWVRETRSNWFWGACVPAVAVGSAPVTAGLSLALLGAYGALGARIYLSARRRGMRPENARLFATFCVIGKLPQALGQGVYWFRRATGRSGRIIEYKGQGAGAAQL
jgi:glycosyltransferase involved in cell wall biosynthesis